MLRFLFIFYIFVSNLTRIADLMLMYKANFTSSWIACMLRQMGDMCEENVVIPIIAIFYNGFSSRDIIDRKREARIRDESLLKQFEDIKQLPWYMFISKYIQCRRLKWTRFKSKWSDSRYQPNPDDVDNCLKQPEFEYLKYLHKLTERVVNWSSFSRQETDYDDLPQEFRSVLGPLDPPHAEYSHLHELQKFADHYFSPKMLQTLFVMMLSEKLRIARQVEPAHRA